MIDSSNLTAHHFPAMETSALVVIYKTLLFGIVEGRALNSSSSFPAWSRFNLFISKTKSIKYQPFFSLSSSHEELFCSSKMSIVALNLFFYHSLKVNVFNEALWSRDTKQPFPLTSVQAMIFYRTSGTSSDTRSQLTFAHPAHEVLDHIP